MKPIARSTKWTQLMADDSLALAAEHTKRKLMELVEGRLSTAYLIEASGHNQNVSQHFAQYSDFMRIGCNTQNIRSSSCGDSNGWTIAA